ncbi:MAG: hypothetical protein Q4F54_05110 [Coriobacteriia bacterium]|nr:hypothetical protein [Coriobacteriia bacterium]
MDLQTVINFVSSSPTPPTPPTPGGGGEGELVNAAQTGDAMFFIVAMLLCVAAASFVMLRMWKAKKAHAYVGAHVSASRTSAAGKVAKSPIALAIIGAVFAILLSTTMVSMASNNAIAQNNDRATSNGPVVPSKGEINAVVDEETGTVSIEEFSVTNTDADFFKFNAVSATKEDGIDDGGCNWTVYLSNEPEISDDDLIYNGPADGVSKSLEHARYIEGNGTAYVRMETDMTADVAKSLIGKKVLSLNLAYEDQDTINTAFVAGENGSVSYDGTVAVVPGAGKYFVNNEDNTILSVYDGCHWQDVVAYADTANNYVFQA